MFKKLYDIIKGKPTDVPPPPGQWATIIADMAIGDTVHVANRHDAERLRNAAYKQQKRIATRAQDDGTVKVWRVL
jgi:hypothetical protein